MSKKAKRRVKPLKELVLKKIADSDECAQTSLKPFHYLSPMMKKEILSHMASQQGSIDEYQTQAMANWMFELASHLLDVHTKEFDFSIFGTRCAWEYIERDQKVWQMLADKCPNLESILDKRRTAIWLIDNNPDNDIECNKLYMRNMLPYLRKFPKLEHISLIKYICDSEDLAQLAYHWPNLLTLSVAFEFVDSDTLRNLFHFQKLEHLEIEWSKFDIWSIKNELLYNEQFLYLERFKSECMEHLPNLQYLSGGAEFHNELPYQGKRKLALREIDVSVGFNLELVPFLEKLKVTGPGFEIPSHTFGNLTNLTVLILYEMKDSHISDVLTHCGARLHELVLNESVYEAGLDLYELVFKCQQLRTLKISSCDLSVKESNFKSQVNGKHFKIIRHFLFRNYKEDHECEFPSDLILLLFGAPELEELAILHAFTLCSTDLSYLTEQLLQGRILKNLKLFEFDCNIENSIYCDDLLKFLCLLPAHAPKLQKMQGESSSEEFHESFKKSILYNDLIIDGFKFFIGWYEYDSFYDSSDSTE
ncbi:uncharacterized protein LOC132192768 isoform X2 [Neocloeon triangulifer]|uniref:uncharacterized protein LOC132192768 isoform X2 n=1 Tax=Neocloeon triangulifer TaxID=2078957 RepID=UPI00286F0815|nr:uncharacterized protein LOC132192768 isoform X2 [Neocloeon triangulifer]XP_059468893.1 uncharacterized protein LOC132192768 isoform X2 [Neocloeon triangulifer]